MNIAVFDAEAIKAIPIIRSLGRAGYNIITLSFERLSLGSSTKYSKKNYYLKDYNCKLIGEILVEEQIDIIFPLEEKTISFFICNKTKFLNKFIIIASMEENFYLLRDKAKTIHIAKKSKILIPETFIPSSYEQGIEYLESVGDFPIIMKPKISTGSRGLQIVYNKSRKELIKKYEVINKYYGLPLIQEYIPQGGKAIGAEFLFYKGNEILSFSHQRIREFPVRGGPSTYCKVYPYEDAIVIGRKLLNSINYSGFAMVEFKENPINNKLYLMEVNPRPWGSISLPIFAGYNFPVEAVKVFSDFDNYKIKGLPYKFDKIFFMRWFLPADILSILFSYKYKFKSKIKEFFRKYPDTVYQIFDKKDFRPVLFIIFKMFLNLFNLNFVKKNLFRKK